MPIDIRTMVQLVVTMCQVIAYCMFQEFPSNSRHRQPYSDHIPTISNYIPTIFL